MAQQQYEAKIPCGDRGEITLMMNDRLLHDESAAVIVVTEFGPTASPEGGWLEVTLEEMTKLRDELTRCIEVSTGG